MPVVKKQENIRKRASDNGKYLWNIIGVISKILFSLGFYTPHLYSLFYNFGYTLMVALTLTYVFHKVAGYSPASTNF
jgi:hypothetical protein